MSTGTKICLAVIGLALGGLVLYYTVITGSDTEPLMVDAAAMPADPTQASKDRASAEPTARPPQTPRRGAETATPPRRAAAQPRRTAPPSRTTAAPPSTAASPPPTTPSPARTAPPSRRPLTESVERAIASRGDGSPPGGRTTVAANTAIDASGRSVQPPPQRATPTRPDPRTETRAAQPQRTPVRAPVFEDYTVRTGDTFSSIARDRFGEARHWKLIASANPQVDPRKLRPGRILRLPPRSAATESRAAGSRDSTPGSYVVRSGDTLSEIASAVYGDSSAWRGIYEANRGAIGPDPHRLKVGMLLSIPRT